MTVTIILGIVIVAVIIATDVFFAADNLDDNTYSEIIRLWAMKTPLVPWICGVLSGHFFHPGIKAVLGQPGSIALLIWLTCLVGMVGLVLTRNGCVWCLPGPCLSLL